MSTRPEPKDYQTFSAVSTNDGTPLKHAGSKFEAEEQVDQTAEPQSSDNVHLTTSVPVVDWSEGWRGALLALIYFLTSSLVVLFSLNYTNDRMPDPNDTPPLRDIGHELLDKLQPDDLDDVLMKILIVMFVGTLAVANDRYTRLIRFFTAMGHLYMIRSLSVYVTSLPTPANHCQTDYIKIPNYFDNILVGFYTVGSSNRHCGDLMFSGHVSMTMCVFVNLWTYWKKLYVRVPITIMLIINLIWTVSSRSHYTMDVWIAIWLTLLMYHYVQPTFFLFRKKKS